ncbi:hypothetical protein MYP_3463 [Sporocytophaga myxococcoides]|uniref:Lipoprotein n=1 Tax=Sporocytophaga myxococcoides TaxID=153721 RepID=A0A098LIH3_9BACT|nr:hypothetical protein [Sporocytophaga myxococcoides]GAL86234.1 hypothetical protein MYP_3463 [Sporocytophaga myxococcoides]
MNLLYFKFIGKTLILFSLGIVLVSACSSEKKTSAKTLNSENHTWQKESNRETKKHLKSVKNKRKELEQYQPSASLYKKPKNGKRKRHF